MNFSLVGTLIVNTLLLPSLLFLFFFPPKEIPDQLPKIHWFIRLSERISQILCYAILMFCGVSFDHITVDGYAVFILMLLSIYYAMWIRYLVCGRHYRWLFHPIYLIPVPMAYLPVLIFLVAAAWFSNVWLAISALLFGVAHCYISNQSYKITRC